MPSFSRLFFQHISYRLDYFRLVLIVFWQLYENISDVISFLDAIFVFRDKTLEAEHQRFLFRVVKFVLRVIHLFLVGSLMGKYTVKLTAG